MVIRPLDDPHMMCSICDRQFATTRFRVRVVGGWAHPSFGFRSPVGLPVDDNYSSRSCFVERKESPNRK